MKAQPISRTIYQNSSFHLKEYDFKNFLKLWHYHPEVELIIMLESTGTRFIGDSIEKFTPGDVVLIGKNLPHLWLNDEKYFSEESTLRAKCYGFHFHEHFLENFSKIPEMKYVKNLFERANRGIKFNIKEIDLFIEHVKKIYTGGESFNMIKVLEMLLKLENEKDFSYLASLGFINSFERKKDDKIFRVYEYIRNNFTDHISLDKAAELANMESSSFSRYFKRVHKKTLTRYVNEIRIGYACKLLIEQKFNVSEVCYKSGYNNVSHFNRKFKSFKGVTPSEYVELYSSVD
jgi:AraC-like DNA-binding protein